MKDNYGDEVHVDFAEDSETGQLVVCLEASEEFGGLVVHHYSPRKARKLARKLLDAAAECESGTDA